ncbi:sensor histidine kinase [Calidifontibacillus oryziterrae]|uniref:sensor histidine kinase n=1 Tax=Calidifontibacillus oryziterrae TaxID=1191699 RepID=UPI000307667A|nr:MASE3 domain-containing protein [Calidifontibacillus oryziterrae]
MHAFNKNEIRTILIAGAAILIFFITRLLHTTISFFYDPSYYLISHTLLELSSVFVSYVIFIHGLLTASYFQSRNSLNFGLLFFAIGTIDLFHTLSYKGMPFFQSEYSIQIATWFWIVARFIESIGLLWFIIRNNDSKVEAIEKNIKIFLTFFFLFIGVYGILSYAQFLPVLVIEGVGVSNFKANMEYAISIIHFITLLIIATQYVTERVPRKLTISLAVVFLLIGELVFTLYRNVYDMDNLLGHLYKATGYIFLYYGIFYPQFKRVFIEREKAENKWILAEERLIEHEKKVTSRIIDAQEEERKRVSRELHDSIGQSLYSILMSLKLLKQVGADQKILEQIENVEKLTSSSMEEVKSLAFQLRPSALDDLGLFSAIRTHIERFENTFGIKVDFEVNGIKQRYSPEIEVALYRIFQEALSNAAKYAETEKITVRINSGKNRIELYVIDEGIGFNVKEYEKTRKNKGIGLFSMKERALLVNGSVDIESIEGLGTKVKVVVPL